MVILEQVFGIVKPKVSGAKRRQAQFNRSTPSLTDLCG
jgi:hypothetical protein